MGGNLKAKHSTWENKCEKAAILPLCRRPNFQFNISVQPKQVIFLKISLAFSLISLHE